MNDLAVRPEVLLANEPVSMLDVSIRLDILNLLLRLKDEEHLAADFTRVALMQCRFAVSDSQLARNLVVVDGRIVFSLAIVKNEPK